MSILLDTSVIIPYLGSVAYDRFVWTRLVREQVYVSSVKREPALEPVVPAPT